MEKAWKVKRKVRVVLPLSAVRKLFQGSRVKGGENAQLPNFCRYQAVLDGGWACWVQQQQSRSRMNSLMAGWRNYRLGMRNKSQLHWAEVRVWTRQERRARYTNTLTFFARTHSASRCVVAQVYLFHRLLCRDSLLLAPTCSPTQPRWIQTKNARHLRRCCLKAQAYSCI